MLKILLRTKNKQGVLPGYKVARIKRSGSRGFYIRSKASDFAALHPGYGNGYSFIEVLVALTLISIALFTADALELKTLQAARLTFDRQTAILQIQNITSRLQTWGNSPNEEEQITLWNLQNQKLLPNAEGKVDGEYPLYTIQLTWGRGKHLSEIIQLPGSA